jgi:hypothetical protein
MDTVIYTAIFGGADALQPPRARERADYVCFTDDPNLKSSDWDVRLVPAESPTPPYAAAGLTAGLSPLLNAKRFKVLAHACLPGYERSIWVDANQEIVEPILPLIEAHVKAATPMAVRKHHARETAYEEAQFAHFSGRHEAAKIKAFMAWQREQGCPGTPLCQGAWLFRLHHDPRVVAAMTLWWSLIQAWVYRDELSLPYALWKTGLPVSFLAPPRWPWAWHAHLNNNW